ncbi:MAG: NAD(P)H-dependent oxidoreductase [Caldilineaceae bacterium]
MKAVILDGSHTGQSMIDLLGDRIREQFVDHQWTVDRIVLREEKVAYCLGCFECWTKSPGLCRIEDAGRDVAAEVINSDLVIFLTPITFGGYSSQLKKVVDRLICLVSPFFTRIEGEVHHRARYQHYPALFGVGVLAQSDLEQGQLFGELIQRNSINLHAPVHGSYVVDKSHDDTAQFAATLTSWIAQTEV